MSPTWLEVALLAWVHCQLGMLALEAVATETQADGLLNSSIICGFSVILGEQFSGWGGGRVSPSRALSQPGPLRGEMPERRKGGFWKECAELNRFASKRALGCVGRRVVGVRSWEAPVPSGTHSAWSGAQ